MSKSFLLRRFEIEVQMACGIMRVYAKVRVDRQG